MIELLKLCGFEAYDIESELPRIEKTFNKLGITTEDIKRGKERVTKYYDIELQGVRKILKLNVQEVVDSILASEDGKTKLVYGFMAPGFNILRADSKLTSHFKAKLYHMQNCLTAQ